MVGSAPGRTTETSSSPRLSIDDKERAMEGTVDSDAGAQISDSEKRLAR